MVLLAKLFIFFFLYKQEGVPENQEEMFVQAHNRNCNQVKPSVNQFGVNSGELSDMQTCFFFIQY